MIKKGKFNKFKQNKYRNTRRVGKCAFCLSKIDPDYKTEEKLRNYISERGKILSREKTGICPKHQKKLAIAIKRARHLAILPFVNRI